MERYFRRLPEEYANNLQKKIDDYNKSKDSILGNEIVNLILDCVRKYPATSWDLKVICLYKFDERFAYHFRRTIQNRVHDIILDIQNSDPDRCLNIDDENCCVMEFIAYALEGHGADKMIRDLFQSIACNCKTKCSGNTCENPTCVDNQVSQKQFDEFQLKSEYPIQCGILFLGAIQTSTSKNEYLNICLYWQKRLRKFSCYFGEKTQEMIVVLLKLYDLVELDVKIELKKHYEEVIENEKLKYEKNIEELNRENKTLKERMKKTEEQLKSEEETNEIVDNLMSDNDKLTIKCVELKSQLKQEGIQIMDFKFKIEQLEKTIEKQASNPKNAFKALIKCPNICRIFEKYETILMTDINLLYPKILSNMDKLNQINPRSVEILTMKVDILNFEKKIEEYLRRVNEDYWKIARNPDISMKELGEEIETIPSDEFMEKYRKLIEENDLKA